MSTPKDKIQQYALRFFAIAVLLLGVGYAAVHAYSNDGGTAPSTVVEHADQVVVNPATETGSKPGDIEGYPSLAEQKDQVLGSVTSPDLPFPHLSVNKDDTYHLVQTFQDATTTILAIPNPYLGATTSLSDVILNTDLGYTGVSSTIDLIRLYITGAATTTYGIGCATAPTPYATTTASVKILDVANVSTTIGIPGVIENNISAANSGGGFDGGTVAKIMYSPPLPWLICKVFPSNSGAFTNAANTFDGKGLLRVNKLQL